MTCSPLCAHNITLLVSLGKAALSFNDPHLDALTDFEVSRRPEGRTSEALSPRKDGFMNIGVSA